MSSAPLATPVLREIRPDDADRLGRLFFQLSPHTIYLRFFGPVKAPSTTFLHHLAEVDHDGRQAFVAGVDDEVVGVARYDRDPADPTRAEVAVVVADAWQQHGLGTALLQRLVEDARLHGVEVFTGIVLGENRTMLHLARQLSPATRTVADHGEWRLEIPIAPAA